MTDRQRNLLRKAELFIETARSVLEAGDTETSANRAYYACFNLARAVLLAYGEEPRTHRGVHHRFREVIVLPGLVPEDLGRVLPYASRIRERSDYDATALTDHAAAADLLADAEAFVEAVRPLIL